MSQEPIVAIERAITMHAMDRASRFSWTSTIVLDVFGLSGWLMTMTAMGWITADRPSRSHSESERIGIDVTRIDVNRRRFFIVRQ